MSFGRGHFLFSILRNCFVMVTLYLFAFHFSGQLDLFFLKAFILFFALNLIFYCLQNINCVGCFKFLQCFAPH